MPRWLYFLLIFAVLALVLNFLPVPPILLFIVAALGIVPLASLIGKAVEGVAEHTGEHIGGLLFATFGNAPELIISILALRQGLVGVVRASIIGAILGNALLVLGVSVCVGSCKYGRLRFETRPAGYYASLLALCIGGLILPTIAELLAQRTRQPQIFERGVLLSDFIAVLLLLGYVASILFSIFHVGDKGEEDELDPILGARSAEAIARLLTYRRHLASSTAVGKSGLLRHIDGTLDAILTHETGKRSSLSESTMPMTSEGGVVLQEIEEVTELGEHPDIAANQNKVTTQEHSASLWGSLLLLACATVGVAILSEILVGSIEPVTRALGWSPAFVGLVFIPLIGGLPEYFNTISMALDKRIGMVLAASAGSSIQIALLVTPILVLISLLMPQRLDLVFSIVELAVLGLTTFLFSEITKDGELVWLEGLLLILLYGMMAGTVFLFG